MNTTRHPAAYTATGHATAMSPPAPTVVLCDTLTRSAYESKYLGLFWSTYLPNGRALSAASAQDALGGWTNTILALYPTCNMLKKTLLALCLTARGKLDDKKWMQEQGLRLYVNVLQDMAEALQNPPGQNSDAVLTTTKLFSLYEVRKYCYFKD